MTYYVFRVLSKIPDLNRGPFSLQAIIKKAMWTTGPSGPSGPSGGDSIGMCAMMDESRKRGEEFDKEHPLWSYTDEGRPERLMVDSRKGVEILPMIEGPSAAALDPFM